MGKSGLRGRGWGKGYQFKLWMVSISQKLYAGGNCLGEKEYPFFANLVSNSEYFSSSWMMYQHSLYKLELWLKGYNSIFLNKCVKSVIRHCIWHSHWTDWSLWITHILFSLVCIDLSTYKSFYSSNKFSRIV